MEQNIFEIALQPYLVLMTFMGLISLYFIGLVIKRQWALFKIPIAQNINHFRKVLFVISLVVFAGNLFPLFLDIFTFFNPLGRPEYVKLTSFIYALSIHLTLATASFLIWKLYQLAEDVDKANEQSDHTLINEEQEK